MGQQQLLLLVVGIVIVGLAVVVGIQAFAENNRKSRLDYATNVGVRVAAEAIVWKARPSALGGGEGTSRLSQVDFVKLGYDAPSTSFYQVDVIDLRLRFENLNTAAPRISVRELNNSSLVGIVIFGPGVECIAVQPGDGGTGWGTAPSKPAACAAW